MCSSSITDRSIPHYSGLKTVGLSRRSGACPRTTARLGSMHLLAKAAPNSLEKRASGGVLLPPLVEYWTQSHERHDLCFGSAVAADLISEKRFALILNWKQSGSSPKD